MTSFNKNVKRKDREKVDHKPSCKVVFSNLLPAVNLLEILSRWDRHECQKDVYYKNKIDYVSRLFEFLVFHKGYTDWSDDTRDQQEKCDKEVPNILKGVVWVKKALLPFWHCLFEWSDQVGYHSISNFFVMFGWGSVLASLQWIVVGLPESSVLTIQLGKVGVKLVIDDALFLLIRVELDVLNLFHYSFRTTLPTIIGDDIPFVWRVFHNI